MTITDAWNLFLLEPMLNSLIVLYKVLFENFGLAIIVFTIIVRFVMLPLTLKQLHASKAMSAISPKMQELQKKYGNDRQRLSQEQMKLYKEFGVNPAGCLLPTIVQFPIWIGLYQSIVQATPSTPDALLDLAGHLYSWLPMVHEAVPLSNHFLWLDLGSPDPYPVMAILTAGSMWVQQKMMTMPTSDPKQESINSMMQWTMPAMFGFFTLQFPSGLALYWVISNFISIGIQYFVTGWGTLLTSAPFAKRPPKEPTDKAKQKPAGGPAGSSPSDESGKGTGDETGKHRGKRKDGRGSRRSRPRAARG
ncbi:MAG: membrane protein insertase YidC [Chloroflexi bacterium]|nr:membrane protein insertase YidC [Chloroflexota bacterium]